MFPRTVVEYVYPTASYRGGSTAVGDISRHKDRVFISEVFRFEDLGFERVAEDFYKVFFRHIKIGKILMNHCFFGNGHIIMVILIKEVTCRRSRLLNSNPSVLP
jgi:hypothetical protein